MTTTGGREMGVEVVLVGLGMVVGARLSGPMGMLEMAYTDKRV